MFTEPCESSPITKFWSELDALITEWKAKESQEQQEGKKEQRTVNVNSEERKSNDPRLKAKKLSDSPIKAVVSDLTSKSHRTVDPRLNKKSSDNNSLLRLPEHKTVTDIKKVQDTELKSIENVNHPEPTNAENEEQRNHAEDNSIDMIKDELSISPAKESDGKTHHALHSEDLINGDVKGDVEELDIIAKFLETSS